MSSKEQKHSSIATSVPSPLGGRPARRGLGGGEQAQSHLNARTATRSAPSPSGETTARMQEVGRRRTPKPRVRGRGKRLTPPSPTNYQPPPYPAWASGQRPVTRATPDQRYPSCPCALYATEHN